MERKLEQAEPHSPAPAKSERRVYDDELTWHRKETDAKTAKLPASDEAGPKAWTPRRRKGTLSKDQELLSKVQGYAPPDGALASFAVDPALPQDSQQAVRG